MPQPDIDAIRAASRRLVRELGFMGGDFAGTDLPPSAVHALIEIEAGGVTARDLAARLHLDKSSVSRMLRKLSEAGEITSTAGGDGRVKLLALTGAGRRRVAAIHGFARAQVAGALGQLDPAQARVVREGLELYAAALAGAAPAPAVEIAQGYRTGLIARITQLHAGYYARAAGFGQAFESVVAGGLAEFCGRLDQPRNAIWAALRGTEIIGSIAIDGEDLGQGRAHLRWFILGEEARGLGTGRRLLSAALGFADAQGFAGTELWTFRGLDAARHLYESHGFVLAEERPGSQWGKQVPEQRFVRPQGGVHPAIPRGMAGPT